LGFGSLLDIAIFLHVCCIVYNFRRTLGRSVTSSVIGFAFFLFASAFFALLLLLLLELFELPSTC
jgi:hypothetical protein